eukprot:Nk52_evm67s2657 gene=Nk52_evmTU67s2657
MFSKKTQQRAQLSTEDRLLAFSLAYHLKEDDCNGFLEIYDKIDASVDSERVSIMLYNNVVLELIKEQARSWAFDTQDSFFVNGKEQIQVLQTACGVGEVQLSKSQKGTNLKQKKDQQLCLKGKGSLDADMEIKPKERRNPKALSIPCEKTDSVDNIREYMDEEGLKSKMIFRNKSSGAASKTLPPFCPSPSPSPPSSCCLEEAVRTSLGPVASETTTSGGKKKEGNGKKKVHSSGTEIKTITPISSPGGRQRVEGEIRSGNGLLAGPLYGDGAQAGEIPTDEAFVVGEKTGTDALKTPVVASQPYNGNTSVGGNTCSIRTGSFSFKIKVNQKMMHAARAGREKDKSLGEGSMYGGDDSLSGQAGRMTRVRGGKRSLPSEPKTSRSSSVILRLPSQNRAALINERDNGGNNSTVVASQESVHPSDLPLLPGAFTNSSNTKTSFSSLAPTMAPVPLDWKIELSKGISHSYCPDEKCFGFNRGDIVCFLESRWMCAIASASKTPKDL